MMARSHPSAARLPDTLVERDAELALLAGVVERTREEETSVALVVGPPGSGRTALLTRVARTAELDGVRVLAATGGVIEAGLRFGAVSQLLTSGGADLPPEVGEALWDSAVPDGVAVPLLCRHFLSLGREAPLLVVIDDVHLVDPHTRLWMQAMARRLPGTSLTMLLSSTSSLAQLPATTSGSHDLHGPLGREPYHLLRLEPLSREGVAEVVGERVGEHAVALTDELFAATGGNPAVLTSVLARLGESGVRGVVDVHSLVADERRSRTTAALGQMSREVLSLLEVVVIAGRVLPVDVLCSLSDLGSTPLSHATRLLGDVALVSSRGDRLVADDVVTTCVLATMTAVEREDLHARAADLAHRSLAPDTDTATLLLGAGPVGAGWAVDVLCAAAHNTRSSSPRGTAVRFLRRALVEPLSGARRAQVLVELAAIEAVDHPDAGDLRLT
ncbi:MAG TPA: ATP-binding protein, partial [Umezawaea sp.]|nr:ATP-binding protein [Umezawaea sp.]